MTQNMNDWSNITFSLAKVFKQGDNTLARYVGSKGYLYRIDYVVLAIVSAKGDLLPQETFETLYNKCDTLELWQFEPAFWNAINNGRGKLVNSKGSERITQAYYVRPQETGLNEIVIVQPNQ
jgi:hypothetical protein